jgi:hypothetical protein
MAHPYDHARSSAKKWGGEPAEYLEIHQWFDATKAWVGHSNHRMFRHHSEGIFEAEKLFGIFFENSVGKRVYTRYVGEQHIKEDCFGYIPSAREWIQHINKPNPPEWMVRTLKIED